MIIEGKIINHDSEQYGQIQINPATGLIDELGSSLGAPDLKTDGLIFPGFVDVHVHAREDTSGKENYKEDFVSASQAAIHGGVVHMADMPNNPFPPTTDDEYEQKRVLSQKALVGVTCYAEIGPATNPLSFPAPYKIFIGPSIGDLFFDSRDDLEKIMPRYRGQKVSFHCEDPEILAAHKAVQTFAEQRPPEAEIKAIKFALDLIKRYELEGKICHLSTAEGLELIKQAKLRGVKVSCEVAPHHLYFDETMLSEDSERWLQVNPPVRACEDRLALLAGLKNGEIEYLASDHAPHTREEKLQGISGVPGLDTYGAFTTWLMQEHDFTPQDIARVCAYNPGKFVNQFCRDKFGKIEAGYIGSFAIIDPNRPWKVRKEDLQTKCAWSPYEDITFPGRVVYTIVRGKAYKND